MAVPSSPAPKSSLSKEAKKKTEKVNVESENGGSTASKRTKNPGLRVISGRIYDSENGKTCHQCRQKTMDFSASCKKLNGEKQCTIRFCHKCLLNRYGELAEKAHESSDWHCPKCKGICNCSFCMKKRGHQPTGILVHRAKAIGYSSVSELLTKDPDAATKELVASPVRSGKENSFDGNGDSNLNPQPSTMKPKSKKPKKIKEKDLEATHDDNCGNAEPLTIKTKEKKPKKTKQKDPKEAHNEDMGNPQPTTIEPEEKKPKKTKRKESKEAFEENTGTNVPFKKKCSEKPQISEVKETSTVDMNCSEKPEISEKNSEKGVILKKSKKTKRKELNGTCDANMGNDVFHPKNAQILEKIAETEEKTDGGDSVILKKSKKPKKKERKETCDGNMGHFEKAQIPEKITAKKETTDGGDGVIVKKPKKTKRKERKETCDGDMGPSEKVQIPGKEETTDGGDGAILKKPKKTKQEERKETCDGNMGHSEKALITEKITEKEMKIDGLEVVIPVKHSEKSDSWSFLVKTAKNEKEKEKKEKQALIDAELALQLPSTVELTSVAGIDMSAEDVGHALQFLEFCAAFGKILDVKKGQPEAVVRELIGWHSRRRLRGQGSCAVQFQIQLLSLIQNDSGEESPSLSPTNDKSSWLQALGKCVSESAFVPENIPKDCFDKQGYKYDQLHSSEKLRLLNFLCDETLDTAEMRTWIEDQNLKFVERGKEAREKVMAARDKAKRLKQTLQDEVAKAILAKNGVPLSIAEHDAIISQIKSETAEAQEEIVLKESDMLTHQQQRPYAIRTQPIFSDESGRTFWRLNCNPGNSDILLQDMGNLDPAVPKERWFSFDGEHLKAVEKYISRPRVKRFRPKRLTAPSPSENTKLNFQLESSEMKPENAIPQM